MNILFITYNGATEPLIRSQGIPYLKGLSKNGIGCAIMSFEKSRPDDASGRLEEELRASGIKWKKLRYHKSPSLPATVFDILTGIAAGTKLALSQKADIIHARATVPAVMAYLIALLTRKKFVYDERGLMAEEYADGGIWKRDGAVYRAVRRIEKFLLVKADAVVVLTENIRKFLVEGDYLGGGGSGLNIHVIPCCVDLDKFKRPAEGKQALREKVAPGFAGRFMFIYTGSIGTWYMPSEMLDFLVAAKEEIPGACMIFVTHIDREAVIRQRDEKGLTDRDVIVTGAEYDRMPEYLCAADAGIFFIRPVLSKRSSCPIKFAEYLSCGLPVVINSGIGDTAQTVMENSAGAVVNGFSRTEYREAARRIASIAAEGPESYKRCRNAAESGFSLGSGVEKYMDVYDSVLKKRKGKR
ncbi:MAG TPA: glycosyltransferase [Candidatus Omnitrophota bacterium]|nr:glycosyltransferase [Candidatus Omnitrophota bacterium]